MKIWITRFVQIASLLCMGVAVAQPTDSQVAISVDPQPIKEIDYFPDLDESHMATLENGVTYDFLMTTPDDILIVDFSIDVTKGEVFNQTHAPPCPYGSGAACIPRDTGPGFQPLVARNPWMNADSWVATPGGGTYCVQIAGACPGFVDVSDEVVEHVTHFDSSNEGAQTEFNFARITMLPDLNGEYQARFSGIVYVADQPLPIAHEFDFELRQVPEPGSGSLFLGCLFGLGVMRRSRLRANTG